MRGWPPRLCLSLSSPSLHSDLGYHIRVWHTVVYLRKSPWTNSTVYWFIPVPYSLRQPSSESRRRCVPRQTHMLRSLDSSRRIHNEWMVHKLSFSGSSTISCDEVGLLFIALRNVRSRLVPVPRILSILVRMSQSELLKMITLWLFFS